jgi:hypothetical protein
MMVFQKLDLELEESVMIKKELMLEMQIILLQIHQNLLLLHKVLKKMMAFQI